MKTRDQAKAKLAKIIKNQEGVNKMPHDTDYDKETKTYLTQLNEGWIMTLKNYIRMTAMTTRVKSIAVENAHRWLIDDLK